MRILMRSMLMVSQITPHIVLLVDVLMRDIALYVGC